MTSHDDPATFRGQLQRGRGIAARRAPREPGAADAVYECVISDPRWDRQVDQRDGYLASLILRLDLSLEPIERHLTASDDEDVDGVELALQVLALLPFVGRRDATAVLRRYALEGRHWDAALDAIGSAGTLKLADLWVGLADDIVAGHGEDRIRAVAWYGSEPWKTWAESQPETRRILDDTRPRQQSHGPETQYRQLRQTITETTTEELIRQVVAGGPERRLALEALGDRGDRLVLDLAEDPGLRNAAGWIPGMPQALHHLGTAAVPRARVWITGEGILAELGARVLAEHGNDSDVPALLSALCHDLDDENWCSAEIPARGLGRLHARHAADDLAAAWENTAHSLARQAFLDGLRGCAPEIAEPFAEEGLWDCESSVRQFACVTAADNGNVRSRLGELADDPLTPEVHDAASTRLAALLDTDRV
jgi:hypothetical protein